MSAPSYIINWEELLEILGDKLEIDINDIDLGDLEDYLYEQFGTIIDLLKQILELLKDKGVQRVHAIANHIPAVVAPYKFTTIFDEDVLLTGVTYSQSAWKYQDNWDLVVDGNVLFEEVGTKEIGESKQMNVFYFVPAGKEINIIFHNDSGNSRLVWFDIEYIGLSMNSYIPTPPPTGIVVVNYITEDKVLVDTDTIIDLNYGTHIIKPDVPGGYILVEPDRHAVKLSDEEPIITVEFIVKKEVVEPPVDPPVIDPEGPKPDVIVCVGDYKEVGYIEIDGDNTKDLVITMEFADITGQAFPDLNIRHSGTGETFGYKDEYLNAGEYSTESNISSASEATYTGYSSHPETMVFSNPTPGRFYFYAQNIGGDKPSLVRFDCSHPYAFTYEYTKCPGDEDLKPFPDDPEPPIDPGDPDPPIGTKCLTLKKVQIRVEPWNHPEGVFDLIDIEVKDFGEFLLFGTEIGYVFNAKVNIDEDGDFNSTFKHYGLNDNHVEDYSRSFCVMEVKYICNEGTFIKKHHAVVTEASVAEIKENAYEELPFCKQV